MLLLAGILIVAACSSKDNGPQQSTSNNSQQEEEKSEPVPQVDRGVGPIDHLEINGSIQDVLAVQGAEVFKTKCSACHKIESRHVGPALQGITQRREPEWIMNMILNPSGMLEKNETAKGLLREYLTSMTFQNVTQEDARAILEYLRKVDAGA